MTFTDLDESLGVADSLERVASLPTEPLLEDIEFACRGLGAGAVAARRPPSAVRACGLYRARATEAWLGERDRRVAVDLG